MMTRRTLVALSGLVLMSVALVALAVRWPGTSRPAAPVAGALDQKIVVIGLDGADWEMLDPLIREGVLPNLASLKERAAYAPLRSAQPMLSPLLWTTAVTGKKPEEHGILDFLTIDPATREKVPVSSRTRRVKALWNIFTDRGLTTGVVGWWATWPSEPVRGVIVSDRLAYSLFRFKGDAWSDEGKTYPSEFLEELEPSLVEARDVTYDEIRRFLDITPGDFDQAWKDVDRAPERRYGNPVVHLSAIVASSLSYQRAALHLLNSGQPDLLLLYFEGIDTVGHLFQGYAPPRMEDVSEDDAARYGKAVEEFYRFQDEVLGPILHKVEPDSTVVVFSDHGFKSGNERPNITSDDFAESAALWHRPYGIFLMAGEGIVPRAIDTVSIYDIAPTVLRAAGLPLSADMSGEAVQEALLGLAPKPAARVPSYETKTEASSETGSVDPEETRLIKQKLTTLGYLSGETTTPTATRHLNLGASYLASNDWDRAEGAFRQALRQNPRLTEALSGLSKVYIAQERYDEALEVSLKLLEAPDVTPDIDLQTAELYLKEGALDKAEAFIGEATRKRGPSPELSTAAGELAGARGKEGEAIDHFRAALDRDPSSVPPAEKLLGILLRRGAVDDARSVVRRALEVSPRSAYFLDKLGLIEIQAGNLSFGEQALRKALEVHPDSATSRANLGMCLALQGKLGQAEEILRAAVKNDPENFEAWANLGSVVARRGDPKDAAIFFERALSLGEPTPALLNSLGLAYLDTGQTASALKTFRKSLGLKADQPAIIEVVKQLQSGGPE